VKAADLTVRVDNTEGRGVYGRAFVLYRRIIINELIDRSTPTLLSIELGRIQTFTLGIHSDSESKTKSQEKLSNCFACRASMIARCPINTADADATKLSSCVVSARVNTPVGSRDPVYNFLF